MTSRDSQTLSDVTTHIVDCPHKTAPPSVRGGIPQAGAKDIKNGRIEFDGIKLVSESTYVEWIERLEPQAFDVLMTREAPVGEVAMVPPGTRLCLGQRTVLIRPDQAQIDPGYLLYLLQSPAVQHDLHARSDGSTVAHLNMKEIRALTLPALPSLDEQAGVASILSSLDRGVEFHRRQHQKHVELLLAILGDKMRELPRANGGYELTIGGDWGKDEPTGDFQVPTYCLRGKDLENYMAGRIDDIPIRYLKAKSVSKRRVQPGDVLTAGSGTLGPSLLVTQSMIVSFELPVVYSNFVKRLRSTDNMGGGTPLFSAIVYLWYGGTIEQYKTGTAMPNLDGKSLAATISVPRADEVIQDELMALAELLLSPVHIRIADVLQELRDALLPKLISGELTVEEAQEHVEDVA